jgi:hypothetical protein
MTTRGIQEWTVPATGSYRIECKGARGIGGWHGQNPIYTYPPGKGAKISGTFNLTKNEVICIVVGQEGVAGYHLNNNGGYGGGGGGGSFVYRKTNTVLCIVAGGGGGGGQTRGYGGHGSASQTPVNGFNNLWLDGGLGNGNRGFQSIGYGGKGGGPANDPDQATWNDAAGGGGGWWSNGEDGLRAIVHAGYNGGYGGMGSVVAPEPQLMTLGPFAGGFHAQGNTNGGAGNGGFGGGGGSGGGGVAGGGGGGYTGGGGGNSYGYVPYKGYLTTGTYGGGQGGGSYNNGTNQTNEEGNNDGHGSVTITNLSISPTDSTGTTYTNTATYNSPFTFLKNNFTKTAYNFSGWHLYDTEGFRINLIIYEDQAYYGTWNIDKNLFAIAQWTIKTYLITIDKGGGEGTVNNPTATYGSPFTFPINNLTRTGYTFFGWWLYQGATRQPGNITYNSGQQVSSWNIDGSNFIIMAKWQGITYVLTYNANGGTGSPSIVDVIYGDEMTFKNSNFYSRTGYDFKEWHLYEGETYLQLYAAGATYGIWDKTGTNYNVKAQWNQTYVLTYNANGGTGSPSIVDVIYGDEMTFKNSNFYSRTGYDFYNWELYDIYNNYLIQFSAGDLYSWSIEANVTAKAQWTAKEYTINYAGTGATYGTTLPNAATYDSIYTFQTNGYTKTGYTFFKWDLRDSIGNLYVGAYDSEASYGIWDRLSDHYVYPIWNINSYTVTFYSNEKGTGKTVTQNYNTIVTCPILKAVGYVFGGWATTATSTTVNKIGNTTFTLGAANQSFFAIWTPNTNGIRFSELQTVFRGENPIRISEYRTESGQTIANSEIRLSANFKGKGPQP